jgi:hypothetical protein
MDSSVSAKDEIWFLRVCHHVSNVVCHQQGSRSRRNYSWTAWSLKMEGACCLGRSPTNYQPTPSNISEEGELCVILLIILSGIFIIRLSDDVCVLYVFFWLFLRRQTQGKYPKNTYNIQNTAKFWNQGCECSSCGSLNLTDMSFMPSRRYWRPGDNCHHFWLVSNPSCKSGTRQRRDSPFL